MLLVRSLLLVPYVYIAPPRHPLSAEHAQTAPCCPSDSHTWKKQYRERYTVFTIPEASRVILDHFDEIEKSIIPASILLTEFGTVFRCPVCSIPTLAQWLTDRYFRQKG